MRCGAVRCGAVRCGAVRCGTVRYGSGQKDFADMELSSRAKKINYKSCDVDFSLHGLLPTEGI